MVARETFFLFLFIRERSSLAVKWEGMVCISLRIILLSAVNLQRFGEDELRTGTPLSWL